MKKCIILLFVLGNSIISGQNSLDQANAYFENFNYPSAIEKYEEAAANTKRPSLELIQRLGDSYFNITDYTNAKKWYEKLYRIIPDEISENTFIKYVQSVKATRDYGKAIFLIQEYYKNDPYKLKMIETQKNHLDSIGAIESNFEIENLLINSTKSEFAPNFYKSKLVFASSRDTLSPKAKMYEWNNQPYLDTYVADVDNKTGQLRNVEKIFEEFDTDFHEATLTFSKDEKTVYLTRNYSENKKLKANRNGVSHMQIVKGSVIKNALSNVTPLALNDKKHSFGHPALSEDGMYLFFVSDMPGGYGASDIYVTKLLPNGQTGELINLGSTINTAGREMFPYVNNNVLYFASDGHYGLGGLDVYKSEIMPNNQYSIPLNLGAPINSSLDDFSFIVEDDNEFGYFASNRVGGTGDDDLYYFKNVTEDKYQVFSGVVLDDSSQEPITFANIKIYDGNNKLISELISNEFGEFYIKQLRDETFKLSFTKQGYNQHLYIMEPDEDRPKVSTGNKVYLASFDKYVEKDGDVEKLIVNPIFFESWKYDITPKAAVELDNIISTLNKFPDIRIKIESHTDSRGTDSFNLQLSGNRAKSTYKYLVANGISPDRIESAIGYGETRLKNYCVNGVNCTPDEHLINRRSDFIVINK